MKKRGFTLIELLAVIIILAIIALIATPIVMNVIENIRKKSAEQSAANYLRAVEIAIARENLNGNVKKGTYFITDNGSLSLSNDISEMITVKLNSNKPDAGLIKVDSQGKITIGYLDIRGHACNREEKNIVCEKAGEENVNTTNGILTLNESKTTTLSNYIIKGNSVQQTRSGKNLFDMSIYTTPITAKGVTVTYLEDEDAIVLNGTFESQTSVGGIYINIPITKGEYFSLTSYYVSGTIDKPNESDYALGYFGANDTINGFNNWRSLPLKEENFSYNNIQCNYNYISRFWFYGSKGVTFNNYKVRIQLEKRTTATSYEPYGVMPSPDYPSEIQSVGDLVIEDGPNKGKYEIPIKVTGKNIADPEQIEKFVAGMQALGTSNNGNKTNIITDENGRKILQLFSGSSHGHVNNNELTKIFSGIFKENTQYTISFDFYRTGNSGYTSVNLAYHNNKNDNSRYVGISCPYDQSNKVYSCSYTNPINTSIYDIFLLYHSGYTYIYLDTLQIVEGAGITEYEPYKETKYSIYLDEPLRCINGLCDEINFKTGQIIRRIKKDVLDGSGTYYSADNNLSKTYRVSKEFEDTSGANPVLCNKLTPISSGTSSNDTENIQFSLQKVYIRIKRERLNSAEVNSVKQFLASNNITFYYLLEKQDEKPISLPDIKINKGVSNIFVKTDIKPSEITINHYK